MLSSNPRIDIFSPELCLKEIIPLCNLVNVQWAAELELELELYNTRVLKSSWRLHHMMHRKVERISWCVSRSSEAFGAAQTHVVIFGQVSRDEDENHL